MTKKTRTSQPNTHSVSCATRSVRSQEGTAQPTAHIFKVLQTTVTHKEQRQDLPTCCGPKDNPILTSRPPACHSQTSRATFPQTRTRAMSVVQDRSLFLRSEATIPTSHRAVHHEGARPWVCIPHSNIRCTTLSRFNAGRRRARDMRTLIVSTRRRRFLALADVVWRFGAEVVDEPLPRYVAYRPSRVLYIQASKHLYFRFTEICALASHLLTPCQSLKFSWFMTYESSACIQCRKKHTTWRTAMLCPLL